MFPYRMDFIHFLNRWRRGEMIIFRRGQDRISWRVHPIRVRGKISKEG
jgi:hypothetical protein